MIHTHITAPVITVPSGTPIERVARTLAECEGRQLPVMHDGRPIGVIRQEDVDAEGLIRDGAWFGWGQARTARDVVSEAPVLSEGTVQAALQALLDDTVVVVCQPDGSLEGVFTEHDGVRVALDHIPDGLLAASCASVPVYSVETSQSACHADQLMRLHGIRHVVLTQRGRAIGMLSHRDLIAEGVRRGRRPLAREVWRRRALLSVTADAGLQQAANLLVDQRVGAIPLLDDEERPLAVLTRRDVIRAALEHGWA